MIYQHPLAYLIGLEGLALLRGWGGDFDRDFVEARLAEVRRLLDEPALANHPGVDVARRDPQAGYRHWASTYDGPNTLFAIDEPAVDAILDSLSVGDALDAACGTGRFAARLAARGFRVVGVDSSPEMLDVARAKLPGVQFHLGELDDLPLPDASVDLVVCALALTHVTDVAPVMTQFARVLRLGGHLVISDVHHELVLRGSVTRALGPNGEPGRAPAHRHTPGDYLRAALPLGLQVRRCEEPGRSSPDSGSQGAPPPDEIAIGLWDEWPWALLDLVPAAAQAAWAVPSIIVWDFERT
ncbi:MAG TPA: class I SAM-dependent methyltransferase [Acidimicrobiales bacterium]|nr:class I SAM-dependent methyltransferase [Acidimicrobiales bacterium]